MKHASAQAPAVPSSELKQQYDAAFQETLSKPADLDVLFRFATLATQTGDWGVVSSAVVRHRYDFGNQDKGALETQFSAYANRQFQVTAANVSLLDLTSGPRFQVFNGIFEDVTLKPFLTGGYVWVNDTP